MIIGSSKGKLISNNISRSQAITETLGKRLDSTAENTKKQVQRQGSNTATDRDTKKVLRNTERVATPLVAAAMTSHLRHQIQFYQNTADKYVEKHNLGNNRTANFNEMGMAARSYGDQPDAFGTVRKEINANMDEQYTVSAETIQRMKYQDGRRVPSAKNTIATIQFQSDGSGIVTVKHQRGVGEMKHVNYEAFRTSVHENFMMRRKLKNDMKGTKVLSDRERGRTIDRLNKSRKNMKDNGILSFLGARQNKFAKRLDATPRRLSRQMLRLGSAPLENSETMRGIHLAETCKQVAMTGSRIVVHATVDTLWNAGVVVSRAITFRNQMKAGNGFKLSAQLAMKTLEVGGTPGGQLGLKIKHKTFGTITRDLQNFVTSHMSHFMIEGFKQSKLGGMIDSKTHVSKLFEQRREIINRNRGVGKGAKSELKTLYKEWFNKGFEKIAPKPVKTVKNKLFDPVKLLMKNIRNAIRNAWQKTIFSKIFAALNQMIQAISAVLGPILAVVGGFILVVFIIMILCCFWDGNAAAQKENQAYTISMQDGTAIMHALEDEHNDLIAELNRRASQYAAADIQYPNGSNENYKELFCAMQVMLEYDYSLISNRKLEDMAAQLYEQTHIISEHPYYFEYDDGTQGQACHINVDIQRNETLAYSIFEGQIPSDVYGDEAATIIPTGNGDVTNWMNVCLTVKTLIAQTQSQYNQSGWIWIEVNGQKYHVRTDCSGYVSACLQVYGSTTGTYGTGALISDQHFPGFVYMRFPGWNNLQQGDILVRRFTGTDSNGSSYSGGHTEIFYGNSGGQHLVFSNGSTAGIQSIYPRNDPVAAYDIIYRPITAGYVEGSDEEAIDTVTDASQKFIFRNWSRSFGENALLLASNMDDITINPETGNEDGYDTAIQATVAAGEFSPNTYTGTGIGGEIGHETGEGSDIHFVAKGKKFTSASSLDYIRYICAQHGVCADYSFDDMINNTYTTVDAPYSPVVDDSIKRTNSGISTSVDSTESINDLPLLQSPYAFNEGMDDLGNLQVGDIMFYVWDEGSWKDEFEDTDYNTWTFGSNGFYEALDHSIPMMYIGDGNFTYYGRVGQNTGAVRTMNVSEMEQRRCLNKKIIRYIGFTVAPVYGATPSFCGWTDNKIGELIVLQHGAQWTEGKVHLTAYGMTESEEKELIEHDDEEEIKEWKELDSKKERGDFAISPYMPDDKTDIDYSFYHEDICEADIYEQTDAHISTLMDEITTIAIKYYDQYGILPSTAYCHMAAVSHYRSTEESLIYFNLFELYDADGPGVNKYTYTDEGEASSAIKNYKKYSSYKAAFQGWQQYASLHGYKMNDEVNDTFAKSFADQRDNYLRYSLVSGKTADEMTSIYNGAPVLETIDQSAMDRKQAIDDLIDATKAVKDGSIPETKPQKTDYDAYCKKLNDLAAYIEDLDKQLGDTKSATVRTDYLLKAAVDAWTDGKKNADAAWDYYEDNPEDYTTYTCPGHEQTRFDPILQKDVPIPGAGKTYCSSGKSCPDPDVDKEEWDKDGGYTLNTPSYENISTDNDE